MVTRKAARKTAKKVVSEGAGTRKSGAGPARKSEETAAIAAMAIKEAVAKPAAQASVTKASLVKRAPPRKIPTKTEATPPSGKIGDGASHSGPALALPDGISADIPFNQLLLDPQNLRLLERTGTNDSLSVKLFGQVTIQQKLFEIIKNDLRFDIQALADSIANNGFLKHERLIVARYDGDKFLVLEGNRRLTAVRSLFEKYGNNLDGLPSYVRESLTTLPCFLLEGSAIDGEVEKLKSYRRAAEIYIGMRHLMGAKNWEPASRYEFQARLIQEEGWSVNDVAIRFGRKKREVIRDFQAHLLYQEFLNFEKKMGVSHSLTYNSFSEAARASAILKWLGWSEIEKDFANKDNEEIFFKYLISRLGKVTSGLDVEGYEAADVPEISAEAAVRKLRDMLKLDDQVVQESLQESDFNAAEIYYEERKEGELPKKIMSFIRMLKRAAPDELAMSSEVADKLRELQLQIDRSLKVIAALKED